MAATTSFSTAYVYTPELYPTILRHTRSTHQTSGSLPHTTPMLIYGIVPIVAGGFCLLLPETLNVQLQDHAEPKKPVTGTSEDHLGQIVAEHKL
nr:solute carrier family 22 member 13-like [Labrus bergylta]